MTEPQRGEWNSCYTLAGENRPMAEIEAVAFEIAFKMKPDQIAAMTQMSGALPAPTNWTMEICLRRLGLIGSYSRSGDNAVPFTLIGVVVHRIISCWK